MASEQDQFLRVVDREVAERLWSEAARPRILPSEIVSVEEALTRVLAADVITETDVPAFDRSNLDGFAVIAEETFGASEETPRLFSLNNEELSCGVLPGIELTSGWATPIATGGMLPRGADAVVMIEHARVLRDSSRIAVLRPVAPGSGMSHAGSDMARGESVLRKGTRLTSRDTGVLAAIGRCEIDVVRRPRVAIFSTGNEIIAPGSPQRPGTVYDANATLLADAVRELGGLPDKLGILGDHEQELSDAIDRALGYDVVLLSGGTSKGAGDVSYRVLARRSPGIVVHGVSLKPGKPICLGVIGTTPVAVLPGFPTSAIFTFHEFVAPLLRRLSGLPDDSRESIPARLPSRFNSEVGRTEYLLVNLIEGDSGLVAYPSGKGSGSVTTFSKADGFIVISRDREYVEASEIVRVTPLGRDVAPADLIAIGSHCPGADHLLGIVSERGYSVKTVWLGSQGGLLAAGRGECDLAGMHLLDPVSDVYNAPFLPPGVRLLEGYGRMQGFVFRGDDPRFLGEGLSGALDRACRDRSSVMVNRNRGSGTRVIIDGLLKGHKPPGYASEPRSHTAVAAAVSAGRADWGVAISTVADAYGLAFLPIREERYDFAIPESRWERPAVRSFREAIGRPEVRRRLAELGFLVNPSTADGEGGR